MMELMGMALKMLIRSFEEKEDRYDWRHQQDDNDDKTLIMKVLIYLKILDILDLHVNDLYQQR